GAEGLRLRSVAEDEVDPESGRRGVYSQYRVNIRFEFLLLVVFLKSIAACDQTVVVCKVPFARLANQHLPGDNQNLFRQRPCLEQCGAALMFILDDIDDIAKIDDIGSGNFRVRQVKWIPSAARIAAFGNHLHICAVTAAKVEECRLRLEEPSLDR